MVGRSDNRYLLPWTVGAVVLVGVLAGTISTQALRGTLAAVPATLFLPPGALDRNDDRLSTLALVLLLVWPLLVASQTGVGDAWFDAAVFTLFFALPWAGLSAACGTALYVAGRGGDDERDDGIAAVAPVSRDPDGVDG
ncbi:MAG: hypothetical protein V5A44_10415 [Haloarculaceae archaeon]